MNSGKSMLRKLMSVRQGKGCKARRAPKGITNNAWFRLWKAGRRSSDSQRVEQYKSRSKGRKSLTVGFSAELKSKDVRRLSRVRPTSK